MAPLTVIEGRLGSWSTVLGTRFPGSSIRNFSQDENIAVEITPRSKTVFKSFVFIG
jgi:hypothetical protein